MQGGLGRTGGDAVKSLLIYWARGMAFFAAIAAICVFWMKVLVPLFEQYMAFRWFVAFLVVSAVAIIFGGIMSHTGGPYRCDDEYGPR